MGVHCGHRHRGDYHRGCPESVWQVGGAPTGQGEGAEEEGEEASGTSGERFNLYLFFLFAGSSGEKENKVNASQHL